MVSDTSAIIAILTGEPEADVLTRVIAESPDVMMSSFSVLETGIVLEARKGEAGGRELDLFLQRARVRVMPLDSEQVRIAREAWRRFGKGRHPAGLNIGDCCAYALAKSTGAPLLFKGHDFSKTDILVAAY
ncbi:PilT protein domain protein [Desulfonatronospira thiodismutans ASO3-1]|uniref:Ribonuclease VapC n=1 Tax=Desulfonatronospira thiodismutans ASO3-1 TaxID=555779 RepID=D6SPE4_9BACT|nr:MULTISPECIES: type II toxin-antitoxin system VapC family toxin [Desulfonatronospira]EFI34620.1 PilT protein domain protein [Desulfonatronospira thiodismutans ASO3-1]RQD79535.1 MAG: type II toxin-antitoxin system VapC family toxin [Desulfonatronospira sp. MSAO_Bac3]